MARESKVEKAIAALKAERAVLDLAIQKLEAQLIIRGPVRKPVGDLRREPRTVAIDKSA